MCARARCTLRADDISRACHRPDAIVRSVDMDRYRPSYNVSPGSNLPVVYRGDGSGGEGYSIHCMTWGLVPSFTKKAEKPDFYKMFNARSESIDEKASFRRLLPKSRCLVAVEGFYEWKKDGSKKQSYYIHFKDGRPLVFAALFDSWQNSEGEILHTFTILTTSSSSALQWLHDRMPVILGDKGAIDTWLNGSSSLKFGKIFSRIRVVWHPVTPAMGKTSFDGPECIKELRSSEHDTFEDGLQKHHLKIFLKEITTEQESNSQESACEKPTDIDPPKVEKEEHTNIDKLEMPSMIQMLDHDSKLSVSTIIHEDGTKCKAKRNLGEPLVDSKRNTDEHDRVLESPARKKANLNSGGDKQTTLLSYFSKKIVFLSYLLLSSCASTAILGFRF